MVKYGYCLFCQKPFTRESNRQQFCSEVCRKSQARKRRLERYRMLNPIRPKQIRPPTYKKPTSCLKCGGTLFHSNLCKVCYRKKFPYKKFCKVCGVPLMVKRESNGLCVQHQFSMGRVWVIPNMQAPFSEWVWKEEIRHKSFVLLSAN